MLSLVSDYQRLGDLPTPANFLAKWWKPTPNNTKHPEGTWAYPEHDGFQLDIKGDPIRSYMNLTVGYKVDRFGDEKTGHFIASADAPFAQRSLPPSALNTDDAPHPFAYHVYEVIREFTVVGGPAGPGFEQPGGVGIIHIHLSFLGKLIHARASSSISVRVSSCMRVMGNQKGL